MSQSDLHIIVGGVTKVLAVAAGAAALQPVLADAQVLPVLRQCTIALAQIGVATSGVLAVGYTHHRLQLWAALRPVMPAPSQVLASMAGISPHLQQGIAVAQAEERQPMDECDYERKTRHSIIRFVYTGENEQSFSYRKMHYALDRPTWDRMTKYLAGCGVLRMGSGTRPTWFTEGWDAQRCARALKDGSLPLPNDAENVPEVVWDGYRHAVHTSTHAMHTSTLEGVRHD